jgi:hypothetical protein
MTPSSSDLFLLEDLEDVGRTSELARSRDEYREVIMSTTGVETAIAIEPFQLEIPQERLDEPCGHIVATSWPAFRSRR